MSAASFIGDAQAWLFDHSRLVVALVAVVAALVGAYWLIRKLAELMNPHRTSQVARTMRRLRQDARAARTVGLPRDLWTTGNGRVPAKKYGHVKGISSKSSYHVVLIRPERGPLRWFQRHAILVANHLLGDTRADVLTIRALGISQHGPVRWPDDDLHHAPSVQRWRALLARETGASVDVESLGALIPQWYSRAVELEVVIGQGVEAIDSVARNLALSMGDDLEQPHPSPTREASEEASAEEANPLAS